MRVTKGYEGTCNPIEWYAALHTVMRVTKGYSGLRGDMSTNGYESY